MLLKRWAVLTAFAASALVAIGAQAKESASTGQVQCKDGTFSSAKGKGACSGHGGVLKTSTADEAKATTSSAADEAKGKASKSAADAKASALSAADEVKGKASKSADDAKARASSAADDVKGKADKSAADARARSSAAADDAKSAVESTVLCNDGTRSKAGSGACSHHGGVAAVQPSQVQPSQSGLPPPPSARTGQTGTGGGTVMDPGPPPASEPLGKNPATSAPSTKSAPRPTQGTPTAKCKDGTFSYATQHEGACSHHGGVAEWLDTKR